MNVTRYFLWVVEGLEVAKLHREVVRNSRSFSKSERQVNL